MGEEEVKPFRLFYVSNGRIPSKKAYSVQTMKMCEAFSQQKVNGRPIELTLVTSDSRHRLKEDPFKYYGVEKCFKIVRIPSIEIPSESKLMHVLQQLSYALSAIVYVSIQRPDFIYSRDPHTSALLAPLFRNLIYEVHTKMPNLQMRIVMSCAKKIVAISGGLKDYYIREFKVSPTDIFVAHDAVSPERFQNTIPKQLLQEKLEIPTGKRVVGHLGKITTMGRGKGVEDLVEAFPMVLKKYPDAYLLIAGVEDNEHTYIETMREKNSIPKSCMQIVGHVPQHEFPAYFLVCDVLAMVYPNIEHYRNYMSPIKLFEYMASNVPIVTTDLPVVREVVGKSEVKFVEPENAASIASGIIAVFDDYKNALVRAEKAKQLLVENHTWSKRASDVLALMVSK